MVVQTTQEGVAAAVAAAAAIRCCPQSFRLLRISLVRMATRPLRRLPTLMSFLFQMNVRPHIRSVTTRAILKAARRFFRAG